VWAESRPTEREARVSHRGARLAADNRRNPVEETEVEDRPFRGAAAGRWQELTVCVFELG